jgi:multidrug efflux system membrane fusion protein
VQGHDAPWIASARILVATIGFFCNLPRKIGTVETSKIVENKTVTQSRASSYASRTSANAASVARTPSRWRLWLAALCASGAALYLWTVHAGAPQHPKITPVLPVSASVAKLGDLNTYLTQIGAVTPFATVTIKSRVAGQILKINFDEGQIVEPNQLLFNIDPRPYLAQLVEYRGQLARDKATLENARITLNRDRALFKKEVIARQDLDNQQAVYDQSRGAIENDQGLIDAVNVNLAYCRIESPIKGRIGLRQVDLGNYVQTTDSLVVITQLQPISVIFSVPEDDIPEIAKRMRGSRVPVQIWNRDFSKQLAEGYLLTFDNEVDQSTGTVKLRAEFANEDYALFPNQFVNARLLIRTLHNTVLTSTAAIQRAQGSAYVYVVQPDRTVARRPVIVGTTQGDVAAIEKGLQPGETVVTDGLDKLRPGSKVAVRMESAPSSALSGNISSQTLAGE